ncbi:MAG: hypothetical protein KGR19_08890, partial [Acidobacteria bacterium]|nr:hypothetical protein [Acidobacteriota bacterium]
MTLAIAAAAAALAVATSSADATVGSFSTTGSMNERRQAAVVVKLLDGRVLVAGGDKDEVGGGTTFLDSAEIYNPATGTFTPTGNMTVARSMAAGVLLPNGKVFITGGRDTPSGAVNTSELYNPATGTFTAVPGTMPTATGLWTMAAPTSGGKVLIVGGFASSADIYDPTTNSYTASGSMGSSYPTGTLSDLGSGKALIQGGFGGGPAKVFDISTGLFSSPANVTTAIRSFPATALLANGKLLLAGGKDFGAGGSPVIASSQLFDPATNLFSTTGSLIDAREQAFSSILGDGKVLVAGGTDGYYGTPKASAELYDPATGTFSTTGSMAVAHGSMHGNTAVLLDNCDVLLPGGWQGTSAPVGSRVIASAEIYDGPAGNCSSSGPTPGPTPGPGPAPDPAPEPSPSSEPAPGPSPSPRPSNAFTLGGGATRTSN